MKGFFSMVLFIINLVVSIVCLMQVLNARQSTNRGTNTFTRFVRDSSAYAVYNMTQVKLTVTVVITVLIGFLCKGWWAWLPSIGVLVMTLIVKNKSNANEQRVKDSRVVTKASLEATGQVAETAGTVAGAALSSKVPGAKQIGQAAGKAVGGVTSSCANAMTDVNSPDMTVLDGEEFMAAARRAGINTDGKTPEQVCQNVIEFAPPAALAALPDSMSMEEKAKRIMGGAV